MKKLYLIIVFLFASSILYAQTWTGTASTNWEDASNWSPAGVPVSTANIIIPGTVTSNNWPAFSGNVIINSIDMQPGCQLDVNGYTLTINGVNMNNSFNGAELNNSSNVTDIVFTINTGSNGFTTYFRSNTINDNIVFNLTGSNQFIEAVSEPANVYNGDAVFNINDMMTAYIAYGAASQFKKNLSVNRSAAGVTSLFYSGARVTGDFTYVNNYGLLTAIGNPGIKTTIGGSVNITANYPTPAPFEMYRLVNNTNGGSINISNSQGFNLQSDTLLLSAMNITGYRGNEYARLMNNDITGNVSISDDVSYSGGFFTYIRNNIIYGNSSFNINGSNAFLEADIAGSGNDYRGNVNFTCSGPSLYIALGAPLLCSGNLTVNRTAEGLTSAFNAGASINGNFSYINNTAGNTYFGNINNKTSIGGTVNIQASYTTRNVFEFLHIINGTNGGSIDIQNPQGFNFQKDTLLLTSLSISGYGGNEYARLLNNSINSNISIVCDPGFSSGFATYIQYNTFTGNSSFTTGGLNPFYEADIAGSGNRYYGNLEFIAAGAGDMYISHQGALWCSGNLSIYRTTAGNTVAFYAGATIDGNLSYNNNTAGHTYFGNINNKTSIGGTVNIQALYTTRSVFEMLRLINGANGGNINIQNTLGFNFQKDSLLLTSFGINGYGGNEYGRLLNNSITGNISIICDPDYSSGFATYIRNNIFTGNSSFTVNGTNAFFESDIAGSGNRYNGNLDFNAAGTGDIYISHQDTLWCTGNLSVTRTAAGNTVAFNAGATIGGDFIYTNNTAGNTYFGNLNNKTGIGGKLNIMAAYTTPNTFLMRRLINHAPGGNINVQNSQGFDCQFDTLLINSLSITGYRGFDYGKLLNNTITGDVTIADDVSYAGGFTTYIRGNVINGNSQFTNNSSNNILDADIAGSGNAYNGNLAYTRNSGYIAAATGDENSVSGNLTLNSVTNIGLGKFRFTGNTNGNAEQLSTQPFQITEITLQKTGGASLTLHSRLNVNLVNFNGGNIISSAGNEIVFPDNSSYTGASDASFAEGPVIKTGDDAFLFPVGKTNRIAMIGMSAPALVTDEFLAEYFLVNPHSSGYDSTQKEPSLNHISGNEYWKLSRTSGSSNPFVTLYWETGRSGIVNSMPDLRIARWNGSIWKDEGNGGTTGSNNAGSLITSGAVTEFSPFTLASTTAANPLPLYLLSFTADKIKSQVSLQWIAENDISVLHYEIERSTDGSIFSTLLSLPSKGSTAQSVYKTTDNFPVAGFNYYRLKAIENSGRITYSRVIRVEMDKAYEISLWPNPAQDYVILNGAGEFSQVQLIDAAGTLVKQMNKSADNRYNLHGLGKGVYYIRLVNASRAVFLKLVIR